MRERQSLRECNYLNEFVFSEGFIVYFYLNHIKEINYMEPDKKVGPTEM